MPFLAESAISSIRPIWVYKFLAIPRLVSVTTGPISDSGTASSTTSGRIQL